jgi:phage I-like protein
VGRESKRWNLPSVQDAKLEAQIVALTAKLEYFKANKSLKEVKNDGKVQ